MEAHISMNSHKFKALKILTLQISEKVFFNTNLKHLTTTLHKLTLLKTAPCHTPTNLFRLSVEEKQGRLRASLDLAFQRRGPL